MLLTGKNAVIYGGGGAIGGAVARAFGREGAHVYVVGRTRARLDPVVRDITAARGRASAAEVDALDERAVEQHAAAVVAEAGSIDIALNAIGILHVQGTGFADLALEDFMHPITAYTRTNFITAKAVSRHMATRKSGVLLTLTTPGTLMAGTGYLGNAAASGAVEAMSRLLACELAPSGVRVVCLRPHALPEAVALGSHTREVFRPAAERAGVSVSEMLAGAGETTLLKRLPTLAQVASTAVFVASDHGAAMTGAIVNLTCGALLD